MPNQCFVCRNRNEVVPCERDEKNICGFTNNPAEILQGDDNLDDEGNEKIKGNQHGMAQGKFVSLISFMWMEIVLISQKETKKFQNAKKEIMEYKVFTMEHLDIYLRQQDWDHTAVSENEAFKYITLFHRVYNSSIQRK